MADIEKNDKAVHLERQTSHISQESGLSDQSHIDAFSPAEQRKIIWRIDRRLVLTLGFMYCVSLMDRTNLGIAAVAGMYVDLGLDVGYRYSTVTLVFFITYVILQPIATVVLRKAGPRIFLPSITLLWACTMICFGFLKYWWQMIPLRLVLGIFEAGFFPGCAYLLSCWYPRFELQKRNAVFYLIGSMASAFSGILAWGFSQMNGLGNIGKYGGLKYGPLYYGPTKISGVSGPSGIESGMAGWRWIFIMQGLLTVIAATVGAFTICDFPEKASLRKKWSLTLPFLNQKEAEFVVARIEQDRHDAIAMPFSASMYAKCAADLKVWGFAALFGLTTTVTYAIAYFLPIILEDGMGFSEGAAECLVAPPYVVAAIWMFACAVIGDKYHLRGPIIIGNGCIGLIGLPLLGFATNTGARYFGVFLATTACNGNVPAVLTFQANNIRGQWKRALCSATLVGAGGLGGIVGSTVFRDQDKPGYVPGIIATMIACGLVILITIALEFKFWRANKRAAAGGKVIEGLEGFRYTY